MLIVCQPMTTTIQPCDLYQPWPGWEEGADLIGDISDISCSHGAVEGRGEEVQMGLLSNGGKTVNK